jgi:hypothetical protein
LGSLSRAVSGLIALLLIFLGPALTVAVVAVGAVILILLALLAGGSGSSNARHGRPLTSSTAVLDVNRTAVNPPVKINVNDGIPTASITPSITSSISGPTIDVSWSWDSD